MDQAATPTPPAFTDRPRALLDLLYASVHESSYRQSFINMLSECLGLDIQHVHLYHLDQGSVVCYSAQVDAPLFDATSAAPPNFTNTDACLSPPNGDLLVHSMENGAIGIAWNQGATLVQIIGRPLGPVTPMSFASKHRDLLTYCLPHFCCLHDLFLKQQAQLPRLKAIRKIHAMLPLPLIIERPGKAMLVNRCAMEALNQVAEALGASDKKYPVSSRNRPWMLCRDDKGARALQIDLGSEPAVLPLHALPVGSGLHYDVYLLGGTRTARVEAEKLKEIFDLSVGEAEVCACALAGQNPAEMALNLKLSINTVKGRLKSVYRRLQVNSVTPLAVRLYFHPLYWATHSEVRPLTKNRVLVDAGNAD